MRCIDGGKWLPAVFPTLKGVTRNRHHSRLDYFHISNHYQGLHFYSLTFVLEIASKKHHQKREREKKLTRQQDLANGKSYASLLVHENIRLYKNSQPATFDP